METNLKRPQVLFSQQVRYEVPAFQRHYVWTREKQWEALWEDIESLAQAILEEQDPEVHFMGAIVLQQMPSPTAMIDRRIVVDGQQRLTTLQLLIDATQEVFEQRHLSTPAQQLAMLVLNDESFRDGNPDHAFKVWPTISDRDAFRHAMSNDLPTEDFRDPKHNIVTAHLFFRTQVENWLDELGDEMEVTAAAALSKSLLNKLELVVIDLGASDDPNVIFETLNARGTPLLQSDMVRNNILHDANIGHDDIAAAGAIWPFDGDFWKEKVGRGMQQRPRLDLYLNHWLTLRNRAEMRSYDEFRSFQTYVSTQKDRGQSIEDVAQDLDRIGRIYQDVEQVRRADIAPFLRRRIQMNMGVVTPLLLWLLSSDVPSITLQRCLTALESFFVRRIVCGYSARGYDKLFLGLLTRLGNDAPGQAGHVVVSFLEEQTAPARVWPRDEALRDQLVNRPLSQALTQGRIRMLLEAIEEHLRGTGKPESADVPKRLQIEHVMPQKWEDNWPLPRGAGNQEEAKENRNRLIHTIGNLTLVSPKLNVGMKNDGWSEKKSALNRHAVLLLNKDLVDRAPGGWDEAAIENRSKRLHRKIVKIWPHADGIDLD